jgi:hypothetical protein
MKRVKLVRKALGLALVAFAFTGLADAQATRTWVSGVGDDLNPCSRTAPCKTFAGAISKTAARGQIDCLDPGGFGAVTITKAITIDCGETFGSVLVSGTDGIVVAAGPSDVVTIRNLNIDGVGTGIHGIHFTSGKALHVEHVTIEGFTLNGIDAVVSSAVALVFTVENTTIAECGGSGVGTTSSGGGNVIGTVRASQIYNTANGVYSQDSSQLLVRDTVFFSTGVAIRQSVVSGGSTILAIGNTISSTGTAMQSSSGGTIGAIGNTFFGNNLVFNPSGGTISTGNDNSQASNNSNGIANGGILPKM